MFLSDADTRYKFILIFSTKIQFSRQNERSLRLLKSLYPIHGKAVQGDPPKSLEVLALRHTPEPSALPL